MCARDHCRYNWEWSIWGITRHSWVYCGYNWSMEWSTFQYPSADFIKVCHKSDPNLNECVKQSIQNLRPYLENGIPELLVPPIDPLLVPNITIKQQAGAIQLDSVFTNMYFDGGSQYHLRGVRIDPSKDRFRLKIWFPQLYMTSNYDISGRLLMLPLKGMGVCQGNFSKLIIALNF